VRLSDALRAIADGNVKVNGEEGSFAALRMTRLKGEPR
jgi:hypothetical protein